MQGDADIVYKGDREDLKQQFGENFGKSFSFCGIGPSRKSNHRELNHRESNH